MNAEITFGVINELGNEEIIIETFIGDYQDISNLYDNIKSKCDNNTALPGSWSISFYYNNKDCCNSTKVKYFYLESYKAIMHLEEIRQSK